ncbi:MAG: lipopolysaccharide biosynthesis protein [Nitrococcus sp.]|nr:lipopolysaccharide biosynthesis protein [Nitrococcus sp.]
MKDVKRKMAKGAAWMIGFKLAQRSLTLISMIVLARLLVPADFGLVAMGTAFIAALELFSAFNFDVALIQHEDPQPVHFNTVWTVQFLFALSIALLLLIFAESLSHFFDEPRLTFILFALSAGTVIGGLENIGVVTFRKELQFDKEFLFMFSSQAVGFLVTMIAAVALRSYWALVFGIVATRFARVTASFVMSPYRPRPSVAAFAELFRYSKWLYLSNLLRFLRFRSVDFIIAKLAGPAALGTYSVAFEVAAIPTTEMVAPINRAVLPGYVKIAHDMAELRKGYLEVIGLIALLAIPAAAGIAASSELLVMVLLGDKWAAATPLISILGLSGAIMAMESNIGSVYMAIGKPQMLTFLSGFYVVILIPLLVYLTIQFGVVGAAWACLIAGITNVPVYYGAMFRTLNLRISEFVATVWRPLISSVIMYFVVREFQRLAGSDLSSLTAMPWLFAAVGVGIVVYLVSIALFWQIGGQPEGAEATVLAETQKHLGGIRKRLRAA